MMKDYDIVVKYYVCDVKNLVVSKSGLVRAGNELHFGRIMFFEEGVAATI